MMSAEKDPPVQNQILTALPRRERERLLPYLEPVSLERGAVLCEPGQALRHGYFPDTVLFALLSLAESGESIEVGLLGYEGVLGIPIFLGSRSLPFRLKVRISGRAHRIKAALLKEEFDKCGPFHDLLLHSVHLLVVQTAQAGACNRFHTLQQRLCRWLLASQERAQSNQLYFTQEILAELLGTNRTSATEAAGALKEAGLIEYSRGQITVLDQPGLQAAACECHQIIKRESQRLLQL
jgi:CRP-like cAMP-binding protein